MAPGRAFVESELDIFLDDLVGVVVGDVGDLSVVGASVTLPDANDESAVDTACWTFDDRGTCFKARLPLADVVDTVDCVEVLPPLVIPNVRLILPNRFFFLLLFLLVVVMVVEVFFSTVRCADLPSGGRDGFDR